MWPLCLTSALLLAGDGRVAEGDDPWKALDRALASLAPGNEGSPFTYGILLRPFFTASADEAKATLDDADVSGFVFEDLDAYFAYEGEGYSLRLSTDLDSGAVENFHRFLELTHRAQWVAGG